MLLVLWDSSWNLSSNQIQRKSHPSHLGAGGQGAPRVRQQLGAEANTELVGREGKRNHQIQIMASEASARGGRGRAWHCFFVYKYCLLFSGLQGEAEWSICATQPSFVLCASNDRQLGSLLPPHSISLGCPSAPAPSIQYRALNLDSRFISYILYMF